MYTCSESQESLVKLVSHVFVELSRCHGNAALSLSVVALNCQEGDGRDSVKDLLNKHQIVNHFRKVSGNPGASQNKDSHPFSGNFNFFTRKNAFAVCRQVAIEQ